MIGVGIDPATTLASLSRFVNEVAEQAVSTHTFTKLTSSAKYTTSSLTIEFSLTKLEVKA